MKSVIIELEPTLLDENANLQQLFDQLESLGFRRDADYGIVRLPGQEMACIRGELDEAGLSAIKALGGVRDVWSDAPIKPVSSSSSTSGRGRPPRPRRR